MTLSQALFVRAIALSFFLAFASLLFQVKGLYGDNGITPIEHSWLLNNDGILIGFVYLALILSLLLFFLPFLYKEKTRNIFEAAICFLLYFFYREYLIHGNVFMNFQWDILLLETSFWTSLSCLFNSNTFARKVFTWIFRFMIFKLMLMSGLVKLNSTDPNWANLTALSYHYYTQPIPNPISFLVHQLPQVFHIFSAALMFCIELLVPFFIFINARFRLIAACLFIGLQLVIIFTGNYCFFNLLTIFLCLSLIEDKDIESFLPSNLKQAIYISEIKEPENIINLTINNRLGELKREDFSLKKILLLALASFYIGLSSLFILSSIPFDYAWKNFNSNLSHQIMSRTLLLMPCSPYGLFAVMTTKRYEIVIQGLANENSTWQDYEFYFKPGNTKRIPPQVAPYQPRLDWQMWFAALSNYQNNPWLINLAIRLLQNQKDVTDLLEYNPFPTQAPKYIRAIIYEYKFNSLDTFAKTGEVWNRELKGLYLPALSLREGNAG